MTRWMNTQRAITAEGLGLCLLALLFATPSHSALTGPPVSELSEASSAPDSSPLPPWIRARERQSIPDLLRVLDDGRHVVWVPPPDGPRVWPFDVERELVVPPGFHVSVFASGLDRPRFMAFDPDGVLHVTLPRSGRVVALPDADSDGVADRVVVIADGLDRPHGITFLDGRLYVAENHRLVELTPRAEGTAGVRVVSTDLPAGGGHWTRTVVAGPDGRLYLSAGSSCNSCEESDFRRASVLWFDPAAGDSPAYPFATGLRNTVGLAFHPDTGELWGVDNGRDWLGDDLPPEELNNIKADGDYGWPYCYGARVPDPKLGTRKRCAATTPPAVEMQAHSAPLGIAFVRGLGFPQPYDESLVIAFHGSWNRRIPTGYKLVYVRFAEGRPVGGAEDFITGWKRTAAQESDAWGRPVGIAPGPDGALYITDDLGGVVYRITYRPRQPKPEYEPAEPSPAPAAPAVQ